MSKYICLMLVVILSIFNFTSLHAQNKLQEFGQKLGFVNEGDGSLCNPIKLYAPEDKQFGGSLHVQFYREEEREKRKVDDSEIIKAFKDQLQKEVVYDYVKRSRYSSAPSEKVEANIDFIFHTITKDKKVFKLLKKINPVEHIFPDKGVGKKMVIPYRSDANKLFELDKLAGRMTDAYMGVAKAAYDGDILHCLKAESRPCEIKEKTINSEILDYYVDILIEEEPTIFMTDYVDEASKSDSAELAAVEKKLEDGAYFIFENQLYRYSISMEQAIAIDSVPDCNGSNVAFIIDRSASMIGHKLASVKQAVLSIISARNDDDMISIHSFADSATTNQKRIIKRDFMPKMKGVISQIKAGGETDIGKGLSVAASDLRLKTKGNQCVVLLSDGIGGNWKGEVKRYKNNNWKVHTLGFGVDADVRTLQKIARGTRGTYSHANSTNVNNRMRELCDVTNNYSQTLSVTDTMSSTAKKEYYVAVNDNVQNANIYTGWQGSKLSTILVSPSGERIDTQTLSGEDGSYSDGGTFQNIKINNPEAGEWGIEVSWSEPPTETEIVNISVMEKSDLFTYIHSFKPSYKTGEAVELLVDAMEVVNGEKIPLKDAEVLVDIQVPGKNIENLVNNPKDQIEPYREVEKEQKRQFKLVDDGKKDANNVGDYKAGDSVFWGIFKETKETGIYAVKARITGKRDDGTEVSREIISTFQVGDSLRNTFDTSQMLKAYGRIWDNITEKELANDNFYGSVKEDVDDLFENDSLIDSSAEESYGFE